MRPRGSVSPEANGREGRLAKKACDQCRGRKVKCDGKEPCRTCLRGGVRCTFFIPARPKGPAPRNGKRKSRSATVTLPRDNSTALPLISSATLPFATQSNDATSDILAWLRNSPSPPFSPSVLFGLNGASVARRPVVDNVPALPLDDSVNAESSQQAQARASTSTDLVCTSPKSTYSRPQASTCSPVFNTHNPFPDLNFAPPLSTDLFANTAHKRTIFSFPITPPDDISPILTLSLDTLIRPQLAVFFTRIYPMIPIFPPSYILPRLDDPAKLQDPTFVALILAMASLSLVHPLEATEMSSRNTRAKQAKTLMDEACRLRARWDHGCLPTIEGILTSYLMFGTLFELGHAAGARVRLKEATSMGEAIRLDLVYTHRRSSHDKEEIARQMRLFWVLAVTERAYALQRSGTIIFEGPIPSDVQTDASGQPLRYLAKIFSFIDQDIVACWNGKCGVSSTPSTSTCRTFPRAKAVDILSKLKGSAARVFGDALMDDLTETQKADLLITWQWIRNRIWRLAQIHGHTLEESGADDASDSVLSVDYVIDVAQTTVGICRRLSVSAMEAHGTGFVEKLYDIAALVTLQLQTNSALQVRLVAFAAQSERWDEMLQNLYYFVSRHRAGVQFAGALAQAVEVVGAVRRTIRGSLPVQEGTWLGLEGVGQLETDADDGHEWDDQLDYIFTA